MARPVLFRAAWVGLVTACLSPGLVAAQDGRFSLTPAGDGYFKLDTRTGAVSRCSDETGAMVCKLVPDDRDAMQAEIDRLTARLNALQSGVEPADKEPRTSGLPSEKELDRALDLMDRAIRRFQHILRDDPDPSADRT
jgi:hypothetical protein